MKKYNTSRKYDNELHLLIHLEFMDFEDSITHTSYKFSFVNQACANLIAKTLFEYNAKEELKFEGIKSFLKAETL